MRVYGCIKAQVDALVESGFTSRAGACIVYTVVPAINLFSLTSVDDSFYMWKRQQWREGEKARGWKFVRRWVCRAAGKQRNSAAGSLEIWK